MAVLDVTNLIAKEDEPTLYDQFTFNYWKDRQNRIFHLDFEINPENALTDELSKAIIQINNEDLGKPISDRKPIIIFLNSPGGDVYSANFLIDLIESSKTPVYTIGGSIVMSAAADILISGHKRFGFTHTNVMFHKGSFGVSGSADQVNSAHENYKKMIKDSKDYILSHTDIPKRLYEKNADKDWYLTGEELTKYKIIDGFIGKDISLEDLLTNNIDKETFLNKEQ